MAHTTEELFAQSKKAWAEMTPEQQAAMHEEQRRFYARGMTTPCEHGMLDFEDCEQCRSIALKFHEPPLALKAMQDDIEATKQALRDMSSFPLKEKD